MFLFPFSVMFEMSSNKQTEKEEQVYFFICFQKLYVDFTQTMKNSQEPHEIERLKQQEERKLRKQLKGSDTKDKLEKYKSKKESNALATRYADTLLSEKTLERFGSCGDWLKFATTDNFDATKVYKANFCKHRFCPMCNMRKSVKDAMALGVVLESLERDGYEFLFLTLTVPNCKGEELPSVLDKMNLDVKNLMRKKRVQAAVKGYIRKIEVTTDQLKTINKHWIKRRGEEYCERRGYVVGGDNPNYNTYHPHMHFILIVEKDYFSKHAKQYMTQAEWLALWQDVNGSEAVGLDIRKVKDTGQSTAIEEIAKYSAKDSHLYHSESVFATFFLALRGRKLLTTSGIGNERMKAFKSGALDYILEEKHEKRREAQRLAGEMPKIFTKILSASWVKRTTRNNRKVMDYALRLNDMTEEQFKEINNPKDLELAREMDENKE